MPPMTVLQQMRVYHATLAVLAILAYLTGELGMVHAWLGYGVALVIVLRLLWALSKEPQMGLMRFYPSFTGMRVGTMCTHPAISKVLLLGIALNLLAVTGTGIALDGGRSIGLSHVQVVSVARADDTLPYVFKNEKPLAKTHEMFANWLMLFVALHVTYILLFKMPLAKFMVFIDNDKR